MFHRKKSKLLWQIYPSYIIIILICVAAGSFYAFTSLKSFFYSQVESDLYEKTELFIPFLKNEFSKGSFSKEINRLCIESGKNANVRFTIIDLEGNVKGDTYEDPLKMENHKQRPEIRTAYSGGNGSRIRFSSTVGEDMMYVAKPVYENKKIIAVLRTSVPLTLINNQLVRTNWSLLFGGIIIAVISTIISFFFSMKITRPIIEMKQGAENFAAGKLDSKLYIPGIDELGGLALTLNKMASELNERFKTESRNRNELETVFFSMTEGVLALDDQERVIRLNQSALTMLSLDITNIKDKTVYELVRDSDLYKFLQQAVKTEKYMSSDIRYGRDMEKIFNVHSNPLRDENSRRMGTLFVIQDVTKIRHLENMRSDFVANVSHELKTPMTAIKGFVETIRESKDLEKEQLERFFSIIDKNVDRLINIINDLLDLSWIEKNEESQNIRFRDESISEIIDSVVKVCEGMARKKGISIVVECQRDFSISINRLLFENALTNLVDNAVKYSDDGKKIELSTWESENKAYVSVKDYGLGISSFEQQRIFERFYRVDKGRSRKMGGTGLGLSIVKHVMNIHRGTVEIESSPGSGSLFTLIIPK